MKDNNLYKELNTEIKNIPGALIKEREKKINDKYLIKRSFIGLINGQFKETLKNFKDNFKK